MIATLFEVWNDRHGDLNKSFDVVIRIILLAIESVLIHFIFHKPLITSGLLSTAIFFLSFDYLINFILIKNGTLEPHKGQKYHWFSYTGKQGLFDNMRWWKYSPWLRFGIKLAYFLVSLVLFIKL